MYDSLKKTDYDYEAEFEAWQALQVEKKRQYDEIDQEVPTPAPVNQIKAPDTINTINESGKPKKIKPELTTTTITMKNETMDTEQGERASGITTAIGHHGSYFGHGNRHIGFEKSRMERQVLKSHNRNDIVVYWGLSRFTNDSDLGVPGVNDITIGSTKTGLLKFTGSNSTILYSYGTNAQSIANQVYAVPLNFRIKDFIDHKILSGTKGRMREFKKISLEQIHVECSIFSI